MISEGSVERLMAKCQTGFGGHTALDQAHSCLAECYGVLGALLNERDALIAQMPKDRTEKQNNSRWHYLTALAQQLNDSGMDQVGVLKTLKKEPRVDIPNTRESLYVVYWRAVQVSMYPDKKRLSTAEISKVYEVMNRHTIKTFSIGIPWPQKFGQTGGR